MERASRWLDEAARSRVLRSHQKVVTAAGEGEIPAVRFRQRCRRRLPWRALPRDVKVGDMVQVDVRGKLLNAQVIKMPFVRNGKALI